MLSSNGTPIAVLMPPAKTLRSGVCALAELPKRCMMKVSLFLGLAAGFAACLGCQPADEASSADVPPEVTAKSSPAIASVDSVEIPRQAKGDLPQPVSLTGEDWPQYRGQRRDGSSQATGLLHNWPDKAPRVVWETAVGQGYAAPSVVAEHVYLNDYDEEKSIWMVRCLDLESGDELWRYQVKKRIRPNHAITRSAPATDGGYVFAIDPKCELHCLDARSGELIWKKFFPAEYDSQIPAWYNGQCPLIDGDRLVVATGGRVLMTSTLR